MHVIKMRPAPVRKPSARKLLNLFAPSKSALLTSLALCLSALGISGCGGVVSLSGPKEPTPADSPALAASPNTVDFGSVGLGNSATQKVSLVNKGSDPVQISQLSLSNSVFRVDGAGKLPVTLEAGSSLSLTVHFSPTSDSDSSDQLKVITTSSSAAAAAIGLHGKGAAGSAELAGLTCEQAKLLGPGSDSCTIQTSMAAPSGGMQVHLSSNSSMI